VHTKGAVRAYNRSCWLSGSARASCGPACSATCSGTRQSLRYVRVIHIVWLELARKNGKSELLAGIALYLLVADGEEGAEVYGCRQRQATRPRRCGNVALSAWWSCSALY
jgi:hypothetical protein